MNMCSTLDNQSEFSDNKFGAPKLSLSSTKKKEESTEKDNFLTNVHGTTQLSVFSPTKTSTFTATNQTESDNITDNTQESFTLAQEQIIDYVANIQDEDIIFRSQQRDEPALTIVEKEKII